jgi:SMP-30/gluconolaconase/LRE-like protein
MSRMFLATALLLVPLCAFAAEPEPVKFTKPPVVTKDGAKTKIEFAVSRATDVEVAIIDAKGVVVRHLAAGVVGARAQHAVPLQKGLAQSIEWDGTDDYGEQAKGGPFGARVRVGMGVKLDKIVGGDPYAFYSKQMGQGDHAAWRVTGLEAKSDGFVYVLGNANNYGPPALRKYDAGGNYVRTVFPPPAGLKPEQVKGWGTVLRPDGTYSLQYNDLSSPALSKTFISGTRGRIAELLPCAEKNKLLLTLGYRMMQINTDGTIPANPVLAGRLVNEPSLFHPITNAWKVPWKVSGPLFTALSPDGKSFYLSGICAGTIKRLRRVAIEKTGFWRDGQVWKVDAATRKAAPFFALDEAKVIGSMKERGSSSIGDTRSNPYSALHGVTVDAEGRVFVCDRQNKRIVVLDKSGKIVREIPVAYPDAIALNPDSKALYVTTRFGNYHRKGKMALLKFNDWSKDAKPSATVPLCSIGTYPLRSFLTTAKSDKGVFLWVAYSTLPVRVYRDKGDGLELVKDFYAAGSQRVLDMQHMIADPVTEHVYIADGWNHCFRITDWADPKFVRCMTGPKSSLRALSLGIDHRNRYIYTHADRRPVARYKMDGKFFAPAPIGDANALTPALSNDWRIGLGFGCRGIAAAPDGSLATLGAAGRGANYSGYLRFFKADAKAPWTGLDFKTFTKVFAAGVRFDPAGNLYVGKLDRGKGTIWKYVPTGKLGENLFPTEPRAPAKTYNIDYGFPRPTFTRTPRFGVDGYGRIYYPTSLLPKVSVIDNEGNPILAFGTYGNRDSMGGLKGDLVPTKGIPMAWPNSVDATDDYIYVTDIVNIRLLRLAKTFAAESTAEVK